MISHLAGKPQGPSLSFVFFSCGPDDAAGAADVAAGAAAVVPFEVVFAVVLSASTVSLFSPLRPSSHG